MHNAISILRPRIVHMVEGFDHVGGPPALVRLLIGSRLADRYEFDVVSYVICGFSLRAIAQLRCRLLEMRPDLVHVHGLKGDGFHATLAARLARVPRILLTVHGSTADSIASYQGALMKSRRFIVGQLLEPATLRMAHAVYCVCDAMKKRARIRCYAGSRLKDTIYNGITEQSPSVSAVMLRESFGFTQKDIVLIYTGRICRDKGLEIFRAALQQILERPDGPKYLKVLLVGDGPEFSLLRASFLPLIHSGQVVMTGRRDDIPALNAMADLFVFPSFHENLSFSLLEAMAAGLPVVATSVGGNSEVVVDGQTGLLVPPRDATALAEAIVKLANDGEMRRQLGEAGRARLVRVFTSETTLRKTGALYDSLLSAAPSLVSPAKGFRTP